MPRSPSLTELKAQIADCCAEIAAAGKLALQGAQRMDRMTTRAAERHRDLMSRLATLERRVELLESRK